VKVETLDDIILALESIYEDLDDRDNRGEYDAEHMNKTLRDLSLLVTKLILMLVAKDNTVSHG
jgi:hypothetical protein